MLNIGRLYCDMRNFLQKLILFGLLTACAAPVPAPTSTPIFALFSARTSLIGEWLGGITRANGSTISIVLNFDGTEPILNIEPLTKDWLLTLTQEDQAVHFSTIGDTADPFKRVEFTGSFSSGLLDGEVNWDGEVISIKFTPIASVDDAVFEKYEGVYKFDSGRALSIIHSPSYESNGLQFFHQGLTMTDFNSGALRGLYPLDDFTFAVGALRVVGAPFVGRLQFIVDEQGNVIGLMWWDEFDGVTPSASSGQFATRISFTFEDVTYESADGTVLSGRFNLPEAGDPLAAFVMLHGSEAGTKDNFGQQLMSHYMMSRGIAILNTDKRGVGDSGGNYVEAPSTRNINNLAADAIAGVEYLLTRPEIDATRIGLIGGSQSGWIIPVAASESENVSFFVIISGPVISAGQEDRYSTVTNDGDTAVTYDAEKLNQTLREMEPSGVDPIPVLAELTQPGLWLWGSVDKNVPATVSAENLQVLIDGGKNNFSYVMLPSGDHNLNESPHGYFAEIPYSPRVLYYSALTRWLEENNISPKE